MATAVRRADGRIVVRKEQYRSLAERYSWVKLPILRGAVGLIEMLAVGISTLNFSAEIAMEDAEVPPSPKPKRAGNWTSYEFPVQALGTLFEIVWKIHFTISNGITIKPYPFLTKAKRNLSSEDLRRMSSSPLVPSKRK